MRRGRGILAAVLLGSAGVWLATPPVRLLWSIAGFLSAAFSTALVQNGAAPSGLAEVASAILRLAGSVGGA